jgi:hypothetical protein
VPPPELTDMDRERQPLRRAHRLLRPGATESLSSGHIRDSPASVAIGCENQPDVHALTGVARQHRSDYDLIIGVRKDSGQPRAGTLRDGVRRHDAQDECYRQQPTVEGTCHSHAPTGGRDDAVEP